MIEFRRPVADDFRRIELQPFDAELQAVCRRHAEALAAVADRDPVALTCLDDGRVVGIGGVLENNEAWLFFAADCRKAFTHMVRRVRLAMTEHALTHGEVWSMIDTTRPNGSRWAKAIGFRHVEGELWRMCSSTLLP